MLNNPGEEVAAKPEVVTAKKPSFGSVVLQLLLIVFAATYLFGMVWLYVRLPWIALAVTAVAVAIAALGVYARLREPSPPGN